MTNKQATNTDSGTRLLGMTGGLPHARNGIAMVSAIALALSGCDSVGPGSAPQSVEPEDETGSRFSYREGGVVLSKRASDELADFVAATQFDAVLPMLIRIQSMNPRAREAAFKRLRSARQEVAAAVRRVDEAGAEASRKELGRLERANRKFENILRSFLRDDERRRSEDRAKNLIKKYPFLKEMSQDELRAVLLQATGTASKNRVAVNPWIPSAVEGDTGSGDSCRTECGIDYVIDFAVVELGFLGALFGCGLTTAAYLGCVGFSLGMKFVRIGDMTYGLYRCVKKCN